MRMKSMRRLDSGDERGAVAVIIGICLVMLFGFGAFAADAGNLWNERRHVIRATDAASLAAAQEFATGSSGCAGIGDEYAIANAPDVKDIVCEPVGVPGVEGFVTVTASKPVSFMFAGVLGIGDEVVKSTTTASWRIAQSVVGLRPFGLCASIVEIMRTLGGTNRVYFDPKTQALEGNPLLNCVDPDEEEVKNPPGNWGLIDLDNVKPVGTPDLMDWIRNGYDGAVETGPIGGNTGFRSALSKALADVVGDEFCLPVYTDTGDGPGGGASGDATFDVQGFVEVRLVGFEWQKSQDAYLDVEVIDPGICSDGGGDSSFPVIDFGAQTVRICAVDFADDTSNC